jgi:hypothetical protein
MTFNSLEKAIEKALMEALGVISRFLQLRHHGFSPNFKACRWISGPQDI